LFNLLRIFVLGLILYSCRDEEKVDFLKFETGTSLDINQLYCKSDSEIIIAGGSTWFETLIKISSDKGNTWSTAFVPGRGILSLCTDRQNNMYGCGLDQKIYTISASNSNQIIFGDYAYYRGISAWSSRHIMLVGGEAFQKGYIYHASLEDNSWEKIFEFKRELNLIHCFDSLHWLAAGFGIVLSTENAGHKWDTLDVSGDHFYDVSFINDSIGYMCGIGGNIMKTSDYGRHWKTLRDAKNIFVSSKSFRCIYFSDVNHGLIAGESGIVWKTIDGGEHWLELIGLPAENYYDIGWDGSHFLICGSRGLLIKLI
jgi:hypothetical protein